MAQPLVNQFADPTAEMSPITQLHNKAVIAVAGTAVRLSLTSIPCQAVLMRAYRANVGPIYWGSATVGNTGVTLNSTWIDKNESVTVPCSDIMDIYINGDNIGDGVGWNAIRR